MQLEPHGGKEGRALGLSELAGLDPGLTTLESASTTAPESLASCPQCRAKCPRGLVEAAEGVPLCCALNKQLPAQGLGTGCFLCLERSSPQSVLKCHVLSETPADHSPTLSGFLSFFNFLLCT